MILQQVEKLSFCLQQDNLYKLEAELLWGFTPLWLGWSLKWSGLLKSFST